MESRTIDSILDWFKKAVIEKKPISPVQWLEAGQYLNVLVEELDDQIAEFKQIVAEVKVKYIEEGFPISKAEAFTKATGSYKELNKLEAKRERVTEHIRLAKYQSRLSLDMESNPYGKNH